jgi:hypothetical protein
MQKKMRFIITPEGEITYEMEGFTGQDCIDFTANLDRLGTVTRTVTQAFYEQKTETDIEGSIG